MKGQHLCKLECQTHVWLYCILHRNVIYRILLRILLQCLLEQTNKKNHKHAQNKTLNPESHLTGLNTFA